MKRRDRELGMGRKISRRDFIDGAGVAISGSLLFPWAQARAYASGGATLPVAGAEYYPPALTGMRGSHPGSFDVAHALRDGKRLVAAQRSSGVVRKRRGSGRDSQTASGTVSMRRRRRMPLA